MGMLMLAACGGSSTAPNPITPPVTPTSQSLDGSWRTSCSASTELTGYDEQQIFNFKGDKLTTTKTFYQHNTNCKHGEEALRERITAGIELGKAVNQGTATGHTKIDIRRTKIRLAPMNDTIDDLLNNASHTGNESIYNGYGKNNWYRNEWQDISSIDAARINFKIDKTEHDIFQISEKMVDGTTHKVLKLGAQGGNVDSDSRPLALATSITAIKQQKTTPEQTLQAAGLIGQWTYPCRVAKGREDHYQHKTLDFEGDKLKTVISFYVAPKGNAKKCDNSSDNRYQVETEADIVLGKVINKGSSTEYTQIGIKTTKVQIKTTETVSTSTFNRQDIDTVPITNLYHGYGQTDWRINDWKDVSDIPNAITELNIGTQVPDIFKISTETTDNGSHKVLKMGYYKGTFDINGRAMSLEAKGAVFQPK